VVLIAGVLVVGGFGKTSGDSSAQRYADAWAAGDTKAMYEEITPDSQGSVSYKDFKRKIDKARATATVRNIQIASVKKTDNSTWRISPRIGTRAFGTIDKPLQVPTDGNGDSAKIKWSDQLVFPGIPPNGSPATPTFPRAPRSRPAMAPRSPRARRAPPPSEPPLATRSAP
jgi:hypothetical protein